jgi:protein-S-isoprenylcysteine O-methyltransferase Ste14
MTALASDYGLWMIVIINSLIFIIFAASFIQPKTKLDWRSLGAFSAFIIAMFTEMYGFPFTIYLLSGWLQSKFPQIDIFSHENGHLWQTLFGLQGNPHMNPIHLLSNLLIISGFLMVYLAWKKLLSAQKSNTLATTGPYALVRHPQYCGLLLVMTGFLIMWPTLLTLIMFPVMVAVYLRLSRLEEKLVRSEFGKEYGIYAARVPAYMPFFRTRANRNESG